MLRTTALWLLLRVVTVLGGAEVLKLYSDLEGTPPPHTLPFGSAGVGAVLAALVGGVILGDLARRGELLFLANLGLSPRRLLIGAVAVCGVLEVGLQVARVW